MDASEELQTNVENSTEQFKKEENTDTTDFEEDTTKNEQINIPSNDSVVNEEHKIPVLITKVDENGNPLKGATLQVLNSDGDVVDEWISDGTVHTTMLTEGDYVLHEKTAPDGYLLAKDSPFTVKVEVNTLDAGVDFSETPCSHYGGTPLYYVEINGEKSEVYCINQDWETPDENSIYDGEILDPSDIRNYTIQTVFVDAHQNKESKDISDQSLSSQELYDKILDIIYHRQLASEVFDDLSEAEIRYVTESALKNYTNAGLTRVQRVSKSSAPENYQSMDYYITDDDKYIWYLYPWYRSFVYDPNQPLGSDIYTTSIGGGDAFGNLARHWSSGHNAKSSEEVRKKVARFYELFLYLINNEEHHPSDMHLYIYSTGDLSNSLSGFNFDEGAYQNLLGITWYNPYDENVKMDITLVNEEAPKDVIKMITLNNPQTGDSIINYVIMLIISVMCFFTVTLYLSKENTYNFKAIEI